jgi:hypothetical protein
MLFAMLTSDMDTKPYIQNVIELDFTEDVYSSPMFKIKYRTSNGMKNMLYRGEYDDLTNIWTLKSSYSGMIQLDILDDKSSEVFIGIDKPFEIKDDNATMFPFGPNIVWTRYVRIRIKDTNIHISLGIRFLRNLIHSVETSYPAQSDELRRFGNVKLKHRIHNERLYRYLNYV